MSSRSGLEAKAKEAGFRRKIADADYAKMKRDQEAGKLVPLADVKEFLADALTRIATAIRTSKLSEAEKTCLP